MRKKLIAIVLTIVLMFAFCGCGGEAVAKEKEAKKIAEETQEIMDDFYDWSWDEKDEVLTIVLAQIAPLGESQQMEEAWEKCTDGIDEYCVLLCDSADLDECPIDVEMVLVDEENPDTVTYKTLNGESTYNIMD